MISCAKELVIVAIATPREFNDSFAVDLYRRLSRLGWIEPIIVPSTSDAVECFKLHPHCCIIYTSDALLNQAVLVQAFHPRLKIVVCTDVEIADFWGVTRILRSTPDAAAACIEAVEK